MQPDDHFDRLERYAQQAGEVLQLDRRTLRSALRSMLKEAGWENARFRLTVSFAQGEPIVFVAMESFVFPYAREKKHGVRCVTAPGVARLQPETKSSRWMSQRETWSTNLEEDVHTSLLLGERGEILEGFGSNVYAILDGVLRTATEGVLPGTSQRIVLAVAPELVKVETTPVLLEEIPRLEEAFLSSNSRSLLPIVQIDEHTIGDGTPGPQTRALQQAYDRWIEERIEPL